MFLAGAVAAHDNPRNWQIMPMLALVQQRKEIGRPGLPLIGVSLNGVRTRSSDDGRPAASDDLNSYKVVHADDIVMNALGKPHGSIGRATNWGITSPAYWVLTPTSMVEPRFLHHLLRSTHMINEYQRLGKNQPPNQFDLAWAQFRSIGVPVPPRDVQQRIADFLDDQISRIDNIIAARQLQVDQSRDAYIGLLRECTTGISSRAPARRTRIPWMPSIGEDRALWKVGLAFHTGSGTTPKSGIADYFDGPYPWVNTGDLRDGSIKTVPRSVTALARREYSTLALYPPGTLLVAMYGATVGRLGILEIEACVNQACCALLELGPVMTKFAFYWLLAFRDEIVRLSAGAGQPNISQEIVRALRIPAPVRSLQAGVVAAADEATDRHLSVRDGLRASVESYEELKLSLVTAAVTGSFDVSSSDGSRVPV